MTADLTASAARALAAGPPCDELLAELAAARPFPGRFRVVRQFTHLPELVLCSHRFEWVADLCAYRQTARHAAATGVHFTVRRAES